MPPFDLTSIQPWLPWLLPPLLGAFIGYVTNYIAIRMLFRPLRPWYIFGLRVPLTPGIIPSKRGELARRMGETVGSHLLTIDDVGRTLEKEGFQLELRRTLDHKMDSFINRELGPPETLIPEKYRQRFRELSEHLRSRAVDTLFTYLTSEPFTAAYSQWFERQWQEFTRRDLESLLAAEELDRLRHHLATSIDRLLQSDSVAEAVGRSVDSYTDELLRSGRSLNDLLPEDIVEILLRQIESEVPALLEKFGGLMHDPQFRKQLEKKGRKAIEAFLDSMEGLAGLLTAFVDMEVIYGKIPSFLDKAGDELAVLLREEKTQRQVAEMLRARVLSFLARPVSSYVEKLPYSKVKKLRLLVRDKAVAAVRHPATRALALQTLERGFAYVQDRSFARLSERFLPAGTLNQIQDALRSTIHSRLTDEKTRRLVDSWLQRKVQDWLSNRPIGTLSARLPADVREEIGDGVYQQVREVLRKEVPALMSGLNVNQIVEDKVNAFDLLQVEDMLMGIMKEQFKYINIFGALLGFLIGLGNLLLLRVF